MNLYLRLLYAFLVSYWQGKALLQEEQKLSFRTWPHDLDLNFHMNNGRYLTLMDLGRVQLMIRLGLMGKILRHRWMPVIGEARVRFRRSLSPFQAFTLRTRLISWDEKWVYIEQKFFSGDELVAVGLVKGLIKAGKRNIPSRELLALMGWTGEPPEPVPAAFLERMEK